MPASDQAVTLGDVRGQEHAVEILEGALRNDTLPNAYVFTGPAGSGKRTAAIAFAARALASTTLTGHSLREAECAHITRATSGKHPDIRVFDTEGAASQSIAVDTVRTEILPFARFAPFEHPRAFVVVPNAERAFPPHRQEAANALLKTLEEPRENVHFILSAENPASLLATIRSRCQRVSFGSLSTENLVYIAQAQGADSNTAKKVAGIAKGNAERMLRLCSDEEIEAQLDIVRTASVALHGPIDAWVKWCEEAAKRQDLHELLSLIARLYRDAVLLSYRHADEELYLPPLAELAASLARRFDTDMLLGLSEVCLQLASKAERAGTNKQLLLESLGNRHASDMLVV